MHIYQDIVLTALLCTKDDEGNVYFSSVEFDKDSKMTFLYEYVFQTSSYVISMNLRMRSEDTEKILKDPTHKPCIVFNIFTQSKRYYKEAQQPKQKRHIGENIPEADKFSMGDDGEILPDSENHATNLTNSKRRFSFFSRGKEQ